MGPAKGLVGDTPMRRKKGISILQLGTVTNRILDAVHAASDCQLDDLVLNLPELTWNQVFFEVDRLSRTGQVRITAMGEGTYPIRLTTKATRTRTPIHLS